MVGKQFRINSYTFVRLLGDFLYLENQVSHIRAFLRMDEYGELLQMKYDSIGSVDDFCKKINNEKGVRDVFDQMNRAWLIDILGETEPFERKFSYANKSYIEEIQYSISEIGEEYEAYLLKKETSFYFSSYQANNNEYIVHCIDW